MQEHLFEHFNEEGHHGFLEDVSITFTDKTDPSEPLKRGITEDIFLGKIYGLRLLLFLLIIYYNY